MSSDVAKFVGITIDKEHGRAAEQSGLRLESIREVTELEARAGQFFDHGGAIHY